MQQPPRLKLIAPVQVRVLKPFEYNLEPFKKGDVITIEEHFADGLVASGHIEDIAEGEEVESINRFEVVEAKDTAATKKMNEAFAELAESGKADEARTVTSPKDTVAVNADAVSNSNTKSTTKGGSTAIAAAGTDAGTPATTATPRP